MRLHSRRCSPVLQALLSSLNHLHQCTHVLNEAAERYAQNRILGDVGRGIARITDSRL